MDKNILIERNKRFVIDVVKMIEKLPKTVPMNVFSKQLVRCASSVGANYRAACRAKSDADFLNKLKIVEEEADESVYFLDLIKEISKDDNLNMEGLIKEGNELVAIYVSSIKTTRARIKNPKSQIINHKS